MMQIHAGNDEGTDVTPDSCCEGVAKVQPPRLERPAEGCERIGVVARAEYCCTRGVAARSGAVGPPACGRNSGARCWDTGVTDLAVMGVGVSALVGECDLSVAQTGVYCIWVLEGILTKLLRVPIGAGETGGGRWFSTRGS